MSFEENEERRKYLAARGKVILNACPGSGKTTSVAYKIKKLTEEFKGNVGIACLSFTNVAKDEILEKYQELTGNTILYPNLVATIDSFINNHLTLPYAHKIILSENRFRIIDDKDFLNNSFRWNIKQKYNNLFYKYIPSDIHCLGNNKFAYGVNENSTKEFVEYAKEIKQDQWKRGFLTSSDSTHLACKILSRFPRVAKYLTIRYPYFIIDEAQDTSSLQYFILDSFVNAGLKNLELIGDPYQCLYQWRNANPELFIEKFDDTSSWQAINFSKNFRSTTPIIDSFSFFRRLTDLPISNDRRLKELPVHVLRYRKSCVEVLAKYEELCIKHNLANNKVVVRGSSHLTELKGDEKQFRPWKSYIPYEIIKAKLAFEQGNLKDAFKVLRRTIIRIKGIEDYHTVREAEDDLELNADFNGLIFIFLKKIPSLDISTSRWTSESQNLILDFLKLKEPVDFSIKKSGFKRSLLEEPLRQRYVLEKDNKRFEITTIHKVKGMTLDSTCLILSDKKHPQSLSFDDFEKLEGLPNEKQRMIYVALSRPKHLLCIAVPATLNDEELIARFGKETIII